MLIFISSDSKVHQSLYINIEELLLILAVNVCVPEEQLQYFFTFGKWNDFVDLMRDGIWDRESGAEPCKIIHVCTQELSV